MPFTFINEQKIFYTSNNVESQKPALVFIHGAGGGHRSWPKAWQQAPKANSTPAELSDFSSYTFDLPGHHYSEPPGRNSISVYTLDVLAFIEALDLDKVILVGHSMGGAIAQMMGVQQPACLVGLVLIGTGASLAVNPSILAGIQTDFANTLQMVMNFAWHKESSQTDKQSVMNQIFKVSPTVVYDDYVACNTFDLSDQLDQIQAPTLVIGSPADKMTPLKASQFLVKHIPNAQLAVINQTAGHYIMLEQPTAVAKAIDEFLDQWRD